MIASRASNAAPFKRSRPTVACVTHPPGAGAFARTLDIHVRRELDDGGVEIECLATDAHVNHNGIVHGGLAMTLLDVAMGATVMRSLKAGERTASVSINTEFMRAAKPGRLVARASLARRGRTMAFPAGELLDADGHVVARASGVWSISAKP